LQVTHQPSDASLAFLLGTAMGVMGTVSLLELWVRNALDNHPLWITAAVAAGAAVFCAVDPLLPSGHHDDAADVEEQQQLKVGHRQGLGLWRGSPAGTLDARRGCMPCGACLTPRPALPPKQDQERDGHAHSDAAAAGFRPGLLRSLSGALSTSKPAHRSSAAGAMVDELDGGVHLSGGVGAPRDARAPHIMHEGVPQRHATPPAGLGAGAGHALPAAACQLQGRGVAGRQLPLAGSVLAPML
jgi:hypothetical protein